MSASRSAANSPLRCSSHRSAASPSSPDDRQLARARLFLRRKRRTPTGPSSAPSPQQIALNDPLEASRAATAASLSSDRFRHLESISSCLPFSTVTQPALVLFPNQIRLYSQQAPSVSARGNVRKVVLTIRCFFHACSFRVISVGHIGIEDLLRIVRLFSPSEQFYARTEGQTVAVVVSASGVTPDHRRYSSGFQN